jgi:hypothetical protein
VLGLTVPQQLIFCCLLVKQLWGRKEIVHVHFVSNPFNPCAQVSDQCMCHYHILVGVCPVSA